MLQIFFGGANWNVCKSFGRLTLLSKTNALNNTKNFEPKWTVLEKKQQPLTIISSNTFSISNAKGTSSRLLEIISERRKRSQRYKMLNNYKRRLQDSLRLQNYERIFSLYSKYLLDRILHPTFKLDRRAYRLLVLSLLKVNKRKEAFTIFQQMIQYDMIKLPRDRLIFETLLSALLSQQSHKYQIYRPEKSMKIEQHDDQFEQLEPPSTNTIMADEAFTVLTHFQKQGGKIINQFDTLHCFCLGFAKAGKLGLALEFFRDLKKREMKPKLELYRELIYRFGLVEDFDSVLELFEELRKDDHSPPQDLMEFVIEKTPPQKLDFEKKVVLFRQMVACGYFPKSSRCYLAIIEALDAQIAIDKQKSQQLVDEAWKRQLEREASSANKQSSRKQE